MLCRRAPRGSVAPTTQVLRLLAPVISQTPATRAVPAAGLETPYEQVLQWRTFPDSDRDRARLLRPEADRQLEQEPASDVRQPAHRVTEQAGPEHVAGAEVQQRYGHADQWDQVLGRLPGLLRPGADQRRACRHRPQQLRRAEQVLKRLALAADLPAAVRDLHRFLDLPHEPGPGRWIEGDVVRQVARQADVGRLAQDHLP